VNNNLAKSAFIVDNPALRPHTKEMLEKQENSETANRESEGLVGDVTVRVAA